MKALKTSMLAIISLFILTNAAAFEHDLNSACKHPQKELLYVAGEFKTILIVDLNTETTVDQIDLDFDVIDMEFAPSGKHLLVHGDRKVHFIQPETGEILKAFGVNKAILFPEAPYFADVSWMDDAVIIYDALSGRIVSTYKPSFDPSSASFSTDFTEMYVLGRRRDIEKEKSLIVKIIEEKESYDPFNAAYVKQQDDGVGSDFAIYNIESETEKAKFVLPYETSDNYDLSISSFGGDYYLGCWDMLLRVNSQGETYPIEIDDASFTYASGTSADGKYIFLTSGQEGNIYNCENQKVQRFKVAQDFFAPTTVDLAFDGNVVYMLSEDYSVIQLDFEGVENKRFVISETLGNGFGAYYNNGFDPGEDQDAEAAIINSVREVYGLEPVSLNANEDNDTVLIGAFITLDEVMKFIEELDDNDLNYVVNFSPLPKSK